MNERLRELALQAGMTEILNEHAHEYGNGQFENTPYPELEKFAQLIVRDCVDKIEEAAESSPELYGVSLEILEHFDMELDNE